MPEDETRVANWPLMLVAFGLAIAYMMVEIQRGVPPRQLAVLVFSAALLTVCVAGLGYHWWPRTEDWANDQ